jgi:hypothetical protein
MSGHRNQWPDPAVLSFPRSGWTPEFPVMRSDEDWILLVVEANWLWRHGMDTVDIAAALGLHERDALRAVAQGREVRRSGREAS